MTVKTELETLCERFSFLDADVAEIETDPHFFLGYVAHRTDRWKCFVPSEIQEIWHELSDGVRLGVYLLAKSNYDFSGE